MSRLFAMFLALVLAGCMPAAGNDTGDTSAGGRPGQLVDTDWRIVTLDGRPLGADAPAILRFGSDGRLSGTGGCNRVSGGYTLTGAELSIGGGLAMTRMACHDPIMAQEQSVLEALTSVKGFEIAEDGTLILRGPDGPVITATRADTQ